MNAHWRGDTGLEYIFQIHAVFCQAKLELAETHIENRPIIRAVRDI